MEMRHEMHRRWVIIFIDQLKSISSGVAASTGPAHRLADQLSWATFLLLLLTPWARLNDQYTQK